MFIHHQVLLVALGGDKANGYHVLFECMEFVPNLLLLIGETDDIPFISIKSRPNF